VAENASDEMVMGAVRALCEFSLLVSQQYHSEISLETLDNPLKRFYKKMGIFRALKMSKSAKTKVDDLLVTESLQLREHKIHKIRAAIRALLYWAKKVSTTKLRLIQVGLNRSRQAVTTWSADDGQIAIEQLEREIHHVTPAKSKHFNKLFQCHERQLLQEVGTIATSPRSKFTNNLGLMKLPPKTRLTGWQT
jgi:hypothetical protein